MISHDAISAVRLFGSEARGDSDEASDIDLLIVQCDRISKRDRKRIEAGFFKLKQNYSICWYSERALSRIYAEGHLFAWHLYRESKNVTQSRSDFIDSLGKPHRYAEACTDICGFRDIIAGTVDSLESSKGNAVYEAGMLFLCSRNLAMIASTCLTDGPYFGRKSPFELQNRAGIQFPLSMTEHEDNMKARTLGHRGMCVTRNASHIREMAYEIALWAQIVHQYVQEHEQA